MRALSRWAAVALAILAAGCRADAPEAPAACSDGPGALRSALASAPGEVRLDDARISDCLVASSETGDLMAFGGAVVDVATGLVERVQRGDARALVELGYLRGALARGADGGLHEDLLRRFEQEIGDVDLASPGFVRGEAAGRATG